MAEISTTLEVTINGVLHTNARELSTSFGFDQVSGRCEIAFPARPSGAEIGQSIEVWGGRDASEGLFFKGTIAGFRYGASIANCTNPVYVICTTNGARLQLPWGDADKDYSGQTDHAVVQNIVESMGIDSSLTSIAGKGLTLGTIEPVVWATGDAGWRLIEKIDQVTGYRTRDGRDNVIRRSQWSGIPSQGGAYTFTESQNLRSINRLRSREGISNRVIVRGLTIENPDPEQEPTEISYEVFAENALVPTPPGYITHEFQSELIETTQLASEIAQYLLNEKNRETQTYEVEVDGTIDVTPSMVITLESPSAELLPTTFYVWHVDQRLTRNKKGMGDFTTRMQLIGGYASDNVVQPLPPTAVLTAQTFREYKDGVGPIAVVTCDASGSFDPDSTIVAYTWTAPGATPASSTTTTPYFACYIPLPATSLTVTVEVLDSTGLTDEFSLVVAITEDDLLSELLWVMTPTYVRVSQNGGEPPWVSQAAPGGTWTAMAPYAGEWGNLFGTSQGHLAISDDYLATLKNVSQPHGVVGVGAVWITEQTEDSRCWVAFNDGAVYFSGDMGVTWEGRGTIPGSGNVSDINDAVTGNGSLHAVRGTSVYISYDQGNSWEAVTELGGTGTVMAFGHGKKFVGMLNNGLPVKEIDTSAAPSFPDLDPDVISAVALTPGWRTKELHVGDNQQRTFISDSGFNSMSQQASTGAAINHMVRSGHEQGVIYYGTANGLEKSVDSGNSIFKVGLTGDNVTKVGFGPVGESDAIINNDAFMLRTTLADHAENGIKMYDLTQGTNSTWQFIPGPLATKLTGIDIAVNPFNTSQWIYCGIPPADDGNVVFHNGFIRMYSDTSRSPFFITQDMGATWSELHVPIPAGYADTTGIDGATYISQIRFHEMSEGWCIAGASWDGIAPVGVYRQCAFWIFGNNTTTTRSVGSLEYSSSGTHWAATTTLLPLLANDWFILAMPRAGVFTGRIGRVNSVSGGLTVIDNTAKAYGIYQADRGMGSSTQILMGRQANGDYTAYMHDYRTNTLYYPYEAEGDTFGKNKIENINFTQGGIFATVEGVGSSEITNISSTGTFDATFYSPPAGLIRGIKSRRLMAMAFNIQGVRVFDTVTRTTTTYPGSGNFEGNFVLVDN